MNPTIIPINYIERKPDSQKYRVVGKGVTVEFLSQFINDSEWTVERICANYNLTPAEIYSAWAFYYDHQDEIDEHLAETKAEDRMHEAESQQRHKALQSRHQSQSESDED